MGPPVVTGRPDARLLFRRGRTSPALDLERIEPDRDASLDIAVRGFAAMEGPRWTPDSRAVVTRTTSRTPASDINQLDRLRREASPDSSSRIAGATTVVYRTGLVWRAHPKTIPRPL